MPKRTTGLDQKTLFWKLLKDPNYEILLKCLRAKSPRELAAVGVVPVFRKLYGERCTHRKFGDKLIDCKNTGTVLTELRREYPAIRVYSFDYHLPVPAIKTLTDIFKVKEEFPALVIHEKPTYGMKSLSDIETLMPELAKQKNVLI